MKTGFPIIRGVLIVLSALLILVAGGLGLLWVVGVVLSSVDEALFRYRLAAFAETNTAEIMISDLARFDWELVCANHPYDRPLCFEKYGRCYEGPMSAAHKGIWVLLFVRRDGSPPHVTGGCKQGGAYILFDGKQCLERDVACLRLSKSEPCPT